MTRKDYIKFVDVIKEYWKHEKSKNKDFSYAPLVNILCGVFSTDNHNFNISKFRNAVDTAIDKITIKENDL